MEWREGSWRVSPRGVNCEAARRLVGEAGGAVPFGSQTSANANLSNDGPVLVLSQTSANLNLGSFGPVPFGFADFPEPDRTEPQQP